MIVDGAYLHNTQGSALNVGGPDGSGTLIITNGGTVYNHTQGSSLFIGYHEDFLNDSNVHGTTVDSTNPDKYKGTYVSDDGNNKTFGKGTVTVEKGSELWTGYSGLYMGEGELNVREKSKMYIGYDWGKLDWANGYAAPVGVHAYSTSVINVSEGSLISMGAQLMTGYLAETDKNRVQDNTRVVINVDGEGSRFEVVGRASDTGARVWLGINEELTSSTTINITNGAEVDFLGAVMGADGGKGTVDVNVGDGSSFVVRNQLTINSGVVIDCVGSMYAKELIANNGSTIRLSEISSTETNAAITIGESWTMNEGSVFELSLSDSFDSETLNIAVATASSTGVNVDAAKLCLKSLLWSATELTWQIEENTVYVVGALVKNEKVEIEDGSIIETPIADTDDKKVTVEVTGDVTLSGANEHSGGTIVTGGNLTLENDKALGTGGIETSGVSSISTGDGVEAVLSDTITNKGELTISGSYDGSNLTEITAADTRVCVDGKEGNNGFFREGGTALVVVDNKGNATLTVDGETTVTNKNNEELKLYASGLAAGELNYDNYHLEDADHDAHMSEIQAMRPDSTAELTITLNDGKLFVDEDAENIQAKGGDIIVESSGSTPVIVGGSLEGDVSLQVVDGAAELKGEHSYTGATTISGSNSKLIVGSDKALGQSDVLLAYGAVLDLGGNKVSNAITVKGCTIMGADNYAGDLTAVEDCKLEVIGDATANKITLQDNGAITGENILASAYEVASKATGSITANVATRNGGTITLSDGSILTVNGTLTLGEGTTFVLNGDYASGATLATADAVEGQTTGSVTLNGGYGTYTTNQGVVELSAVFNQNYADALTVSNWGIATASRAVVNAVRGQRSNTGCIADGKGTAWVASLGGNNDINGSDISLSGAALGADMQVGAASRVGIAMGYVEGEVRPSGLRQVDQEGSYIAAYGEHGLKKLSSTSCLSMDWVAAYGVTDSEGAGQKWEQDSVQLNSRVNWNKKVNDKLCMSVFSGLEYFANNSDTVDGVKTGSIQNLRGEIGVGARYVAWGAPAATASYDEKGAMLTDARPGCEKLVLNGEIRYMNDMVRSNPVIRMEGLSGMGENPGRQGMGIEAGATYRIGERWSASANYGFNTMEDSKEHRVNVGAAYTF